MCDLRRRHFRLTPARDLAAFFEIQMQIRGGNENSSFMQDFDIATKSHFKLASTTKYT